MVRTIIQLEENQVSQLRELCGREGISRSEAIRRAVDRFLEEYRSEEPDDAFGLWEGRGEDAIEYLDRLREEW